MDELYKELKEASPEELLEAVLYHYGMNAIITHNRAGLLKLGFALARENGWRHVAPAWLGEYRNKTPLFVD